MKKRLSALLLAAVLVLLCAACTPAAEVTPTPTLEATPTPTPTPTPEPTPAHRWLYDYTYTSEALGATFKFPTDWAYYFDFAEEETVLDVRDQDGNWLEGGLTCTSLRLYPKSFTIDDGNGYILPLAEICFTPKGMIWGEDHVLPLLETEEGTYYCGFYPLLQLWYEPGISADGAKFAIINAVQGGIQDGRWEIELLEPKS